MSRKKKAADEVFCTSCGDPVKKEAEICPNCGVPNEVGSGSSSATKAAGQSTTSTSPHDPSNYETTVSDTWWYGVGASVILWLIGFAMPEGTTVAGFFFLIAWVLMPMSIYFDRQWLRATTSWEPNETAWVVLSVVPLINIVAGCVYLFRRHQAEQISTPTAQSSKEIANSPEDAAIQKLRERYADGELTDTEFEEKVEKMLETESVDDPEAFTESKK